MHDGDTSINIRTRGIRDIDIGGGGGSGSRKSSTVTKTTRSVRFESWLDSVGVIKPLEVRR